ncbi:phosphoglycerate mutase [Raphidocelis subcapitata]|uniref:Phosphoglycerate mutase n=1 Tax=Raphidocelis subcapitata TaxID=307507 RepID=A0A2V0NT16_9CHLO|nr:phosphoglycerate mutase [Raphidocelis subcapitata]|eukprot:GBF90774.1 phosphoglycerate mutase [Raphidocelis subcapitata]
MRRRAALALPALLAALLTAAPAAYARDVPLSELAKPGRVLMLRHANAPGTGDPPGFNLTDCATQRNLDAKGRDQARATGAALRKAVPSGQLPAVKVYSSQWCRARDTADLLAAAAGLARPQPRAFLNSFFAEPAAAGPILRDLRAFLAQLPRGGPPVILVTHQVVISSFTDAFPDSAGGSIFEANGTGEPKWIGSLAPVA